MQEIPKSRLKTFLDFSLDSQRERLILARFLEFKFGEKSLSPNQVYFNNSTSQRFKVKKTSYFITYQNCKSRNPFFIFNSGSNVNAKDNYGKTPLTLAIEKGNEVNVGYLIQNGNADIHSADENGMTPLLTAAKKNQLSIFKFLLSKGSDPKVKDEIYGWNSLFWLSAHGNADGVCIV